MNQIQTRVPVIDIFAGPGGLGEGFSAYPIEGTESIFKIRLSLEKEENAHRTLQLRAFYRQFRKGEAPEGYYRLLRQEITLSELYAAYPAEAKAAANEALQVTLGLGNWEFTRDKIAGALDGWESSQQGGCRLRCTGGQPAFPLPRVPAHSGHLQTIRLCDGER